MDRLSWSNLEKDAVVERAVEMRGTDPALTAKDALYRAQGEVIEASRQKAKLTWHLEKVLVQRIERHKPVVQPVPVEPPPPPPQKTPLEVMLEFLQPVFTAMGREVVAQVNERLRALENAVFSAKNGHMLPLPEAKTHQQRVLIIGANADQQRSLEKSFPAVDFRFAANGAASSKVASMAGSCDLTISMTKFVSHQVEKHVKDRPDYVRVNGGVSAIGTVLIDRLRMHA